MKKKGFTLVELLAVIAILAILVIIALPNIMDLFNQAKMNSFENEVKEIYKTAQSQWLTDSLSNPQEIAYSRCSDCTNPLKLSGRSDIDYYIKLTKKGDVVYYVASDGSFQYKHTNGNKLNIEDISVSKTSDLDDSEKIHVSNTGVKNISKFVIRQNSSAITPGDELKIAGESFYVVTSNSTETVLLSKYDLNIPSNSQASTSSKTATLIKFANIGYWDGCKYSSSTMACTSSPQGLLSPYKDGGKAYCSSLRTSNCAYVYDNNSNLYSPIVAYVNKISSSSGATFRGILLEISDIMNLMTSGSYGMMAMMDKNNGCYWLGTPVSIDAINVIYSNGEWSTNSSWGAGCAIRPALVVNTSAL